MHPLNSSSGVSNSKRRRPTDSKSSRRFTVREMKKKEILPLSPSPPMPRKLKNANARRGSRFLAFVALFFISLSTITVWRRRSQVPYHSHQQLFESSRFQHRDPPSANHLSSAFLDQQQQQPNNSSNAITDLNTNTDSLNDSSVAASDLNDGTHNSSALDPDQPKVASTFDLPSDSYHSDNSTQTDGDDHTPQHQDQSQSADSVNSGSVSSGSANSGSAAAEEKTEDSSRVELDDMANVPMEENVPERVEWYTRTDFKDGLRPICRITHPFVLSNGTILLPDWMDRHRRTLKRCNLGPFDFYTPEVPPTAVLKETNNLDVDFALTIHLERFQEPTHDPSVYLTEHLLKPAYLFEVFGGTVNLLEGTNERRCFALLNGSDCSSPRPPRTGLKPGIFVPFKLEHSEKTSWSHQLLDMMGKAYAHAGGELVHLNTSSIVLAEHRHKTDGLIGTRFRSIIAMDGMFRHLPADGLKSSRLYSRINGISKEDHSFKGAGGCSLSIGIANSEHMEIIRGGAELQEKLNVMVKFALPSASIDVSLIDVSPSASDIGEVKKHLQSIDVLLGGGPELNHIGFMRPSSTVYELMPFGIKPVVYQSLARVLGLSYESVSGKPHDDVFKTCIDSEVYNLKKQGKVDDTPEWHEPLIKAWDAAVAEYMFSGKTDFDINRNRTIKNYQSRTCAMKQPIEVSPDDTARRVMHTIKDKCGMQ